jgi:short-subunit dehydrogenase
VTDASQIAAAARRLTELDILISNAGVTYMTPFKETTIEHARLVMETNFFGPLQLMYAFGETLSRRKGGYIYILSLAGLIAAQGAEVYSASKAAGAMVGHGLRGAFPDVAVSLVYPGLMDTDMMASATLKKTSPEEVGSRTLDGWLAGELSVFPDLHAEFTRDAFVSQGADILADPPQVMRAIIERYISVRGL